MFCFHTSMLERKSGEEVRRMRKLMHEKGSCSSMSLMEYPIHLVEDRSLPESTEPNTKSNDSKVETGWLVAEISEDLVNMD